MATRSASAGTAVRSPARRLRPPRSSRTPAEEKPLMTNQAILLMNFGFFGIQYSFGLQQTAAEEEQLYRHYGFVDEDEDEDEDEDLPLPPPAH